MSNNWSWACVAAPQDKRAIDAITKAAPNLSTCPPSPENGQVDRLIPSLDIEPQTVSCAGDPHAFDERAAIIEANGISRAWAEGYAVLWTMPRPSGYSSERWEQLVNDGGRFLDAWGLQAAALGWCAADVFSANPRAPENAYCDIGLVPLLQGRPVVTITTDTARIDCGNDTHLTIYRKTIGADAVAIWEVE